MKGYLWLRLQIGGRLLAELGWWRLALLGPFLLLSVARAFVVLAPHAAGQWLVPLLVALFIVSQHRRRPDLAFLQLTAPRFRPWLAAEYGLWSFPAVAALLAFGQLGAALLTLGLAVAAAWLPAARPEDSKKRRRSLMRSEALELVSGLRQTAAAVWWPLLLAGAAWGRQYPEVPALALVVWLLLLAGCYGNPEPWTLLLPALRQPGAWLRRRVGLALLYLLLTAAPFAGLLALGPAGAGGAGLLLLGGAVLLTMVVLARYAFYPDALLVRLTQGAILSLTLLAGQPVFPALLLVAFAGLLWKSRQRLSTFRQD
ncbi:hypothetical protein [Hymenobacter sp. APR13]|uniref:hypothetical protein n=1 Tax=Hymenobacter sp. APR13 TaxID=1356852 RepID=UPI0004E03708|nr:hypothetical protein [Hymenobacter sp. APR13]AII54104.1 hypothetical protein N008_19220 [Hymenobacter sp. APR13]